MGTTHSVLGDNGLFLNLTQSVEAMRIMLLINNCILKHKTTTSRSMNDCTSALQEKAMGNRKFENSLN